MAKRRGNNKGSNRRRKFPVPTESYDNRVLKDFERLFPSIKCLTPVELDELTKRVNHLSDFEKKARIPYQVANYISKWISGKPQFEERGLLDELAKPGSSRKIKYFFRDLWDGDSMMIIKEGQLPITEGFNLLIAHSDSPCLRIKSKPIKLEWDPSKQYDFWGTRLSATAHGGLSVYQWPGQEVSIVGYALDRHGNKRFIEMPAFVPGASAHVDYTGKETVEDTFKSEQTFEVYPGHTSLDETLKRFEFESIDDFGQAKLFAVPLTEPIPIDEYTWRLLCAYGHDDKACTFSAVSAITRVRQPKLTSIIWITDNEEVGDVPPSGAKGGPFLDFVLDYLCEKYERRQNRKSRKKLTDKDKRTLLLKSSFIYADTNVAPFGYDAENEDIDATNSPKIGLGVSIETGRNAVSSLDFTRKLRDFARRGTAREVNLCHQVVGQVYHQDKETVWWYENWAEATLRFIGQWAYNIGIPCASTHGPTEIICPGDEYATYRYFRRFLGSNIGIGDSVADKRKKRK